MTLPLILRIGASAGLSQADEAVLARLYTCPAQLVAPRIDLIREGDDPGHVSLVVDGWACRYKITREGQRQIVGILLPGDFCDLDGYLLGRRDYNIGALTRLRVAQVPRGIIAAMTADHPRLAQALRRHDLIDMSIQREWLVNMGQRTAYERTGHLLVELFYRSRAVGLALGNNCECPMTQNDIADATGLTSVHVNRTLQELRRQGLIVLDRKRLELPDLAALIRASGFDPDYLHCNPALQSSGAHA